MNTMWQELETGEPSPVTTVKSLLPCTNYLVFKKLIPLLSYKLLFHLFYL